MDNMSVINNGAPYPLYISPSLKRLRQTKDDAFYTAATESDANGYDPIEFYYQIADELENKGFSNLITAAKQKWKTEQEDTKKQTINALINDSGLDKDTKRQALQNYIYNNIVSDDLKDRYIDSLSFNNLQSKQDVTQDDIDKSISETINLKNDQFIEKLQSITTKTLQSGPSSDYTDEEIVNELTKFNPKTLEDIDKVITQVGAELPALFYMLVGSAPAWLVDIYDTYNIKAKDPSRFKNMLPQNALLDLGIQFLAPNQDKQGLAYKNLTEIREYVRKRNAKEAWSYQWQYAIEDMLKDAGYDMEVINKTLTMKAFNTLGEGIQAISEFINPEDPAAVSMPLEIFTAFFGAKLVKAPFKARARARERAQAREEARFQRARDVTPEQTRDIGELLIEEQQGGPVIVRSTPPADVPPLNSPIVSTLRTNPDMGRTLIDDVIMDRSGQLGNVVNLDAAKLLNLLFRVDGTVTRNPAIGWTHDSVRLWELETLKQRDAQLLALDPTMPTYQASRLFLEDMAHTLNGIEPSVPTIISSTFTKARFLPTGIETNLTFRKSSTTDYTAQEALAVLEDIKTAIERYSQNEFTPDNIKNSNLEIQEINSEGLVVNRMFSPSEFARNWEAGDISNDTFRVVWNKRETPYEGYLPQGKEFGVTPQEFQTNKLTKWYFDSDTNVLGIPVRGTGSELMFKYGRLQRGTEEMIYSSRILSQSYLREQQKIVRETAWKGLNAREQGQLARVLDHAQQNQMDYVTLGDIREINGINIRETSAVKIQEAFNVMMSHADFLYRLSNVREITRLSKDGYVEGGYYLDVNGNRKFMPGKNTFAIKEITSRTDPQFITESPAKYWDFEAGQSKELVPTKANYGNVPQMVYERGMPSSKLYRLAYDFVDPLTGAIYQYGTFGKQKVTSLPTNIFPKRKGYYPTIHLDNYVTEAYPLRVEINGHTLDFSNLDLGDMNVLGLDKSLTAEQLNNRSKVMQAMQPHKQSVAMREFKSELDRWNTFNLREASPDIRRVPSLYLHNTRKVKELNIQGIEDHFRLLDSIDMHSVARNKGLNFKLTEGAYASLVEAGTTAGRAALETLQLNRLKLAWLETWKDSKRIALQPNPEKSVDLMSDTVLTRIDKEFPMDLSQIKDMPEMESHGRQARAEWLKIYEQDKGWNTRWSTNTTSHILNAFGNMTEFDVSRAVNRAIRRSQRNPNEAREVVSRAVTTFMVLINFPKQLFLQPLATIGAGLTTARLMPTKTVQGLVDVLGVLSVRLAEKHFMDKPMYKSLQEVHKYMFDQAHIYDGVGGPGKFFFSKLTKKDYDLINAWGRESGLFQVSDHIFAKGIGSSKIPELGKKMDLSDPTNLLRIQEYPGIVGRAVTDAGFTLGEYINRVAGFIVALRNWENKNPGKNWRNVDALREISYDAQQFTGSMTNATRYAWQKIPLARELFKFESFMHSMSEGMLMKNSLRFTGPERVLYSFLNYALYGTGAYGVMQLINDGIQSAVGEDKDITWFKKMNLFYQMNMVMDNLLGAKTDKDGNVITPSESLYGEVFSPVPAEVNLPFWFKVGRLAMKIINGNLTSRDLGATVSWIKGINDGMNLVADLYGNANLSFTPEEKRRIVGKVLTNYIPFLKGPLKTIAALDIMEQATATGSVLGYQPTEAELIAKNYLGVPSLKERSTVQLLKDKNTRRTAIEGYAKDMLKLITLASKDGIPKLQDAKDMIMAYRFMLDEQDYLKGDQAHKDFADIIISYMTRNSKPLAEQLADSFRHNFQGNRPFYDSQEIAQARLLAETLERDDPKQAKWFKEQAEAMQRANDRYIEE